MEADVGQFVHEAEPEVVDAVVAQGEADDRATVQETQGRAVEMGAGEVALDHEGDAVRMKGEALLGAPRAVFVNAQLSDFTHEEFRYRARLVAGLGSVLVGLSKDAPAPGFEGVGVGLGVDAAVAVLAVEGKGSGLGPSRFFDQGVDQLFSAVE